ncbi:MAG: hypothetical protein COV29_00115 [Candidatus Yanofskybacteria bacterium CG10_big_fil_rev_8_21_14_0_10_36_16]|uniref:Uncharacterized protein n=1 Tax=Candidatus Yanofskybacteria bacterium CG10_big_fil_rev_8_21_14_0_10_36_16 TaxID=1975096 RepID=A0A2J0Q8H1_9BACT|nr:MAG: hypothetical protein COV29_00115 [Candidatus Yanofskybacteria bacterium CG10_big_fil_rev_8_21_14_0_10_36_16]
MARKPEYGGKCKCGGDIWEVFVVQPPPSNPLDFVMGPGISDGYKCNKCGRKFELPQLELALDDLQELEKKLLKRQKQP